MLKELVILYSKIFKHLGEEDLITILIIPLAIVTLTVKCLFHYD